MAYSDFSLEQVIDEFALTQTQADLFLDVVAIEPSSWLRETLSFSQPLALRSGTEKARSEFIVGPVLLELERRNPKKVTIYSGKSLNGDQSLGLNGECDFLLGRGEATYVVKAPIVSIVEAKRQDISLGLGQCSAQMIGAQRFNQRKHEPVSSIYGCVTTGELWKFLRLEDTNLVIDDRSYLLSLELNTIIGIFQTVIDRAGYPLPVGQH
jgi:hypothetical protein